MSNLLLRINRLTAIAVLTAVCLCVAVAAHAQSDVQLSQYYEVGSVYNPAAIGRTDNIRLRAAGRLQWVGIHGAPSTFLAAGDMPFRLGGKRLATGLVLQQESIGLYNSLNINAQIAYKLRKAGGEFTIALQPGMYDQRFRGSEVYIPDGDDYHESADNAIPSVDLHGTALDMAAGIFFERKKWWVGVSGQHLTAPTITMGGENGSQGSDAYVYEFKAPRALYFMGGGNIKLKNTLFELMPSMLAKTDFTNYSVEVNARIRYNSFLSGGLGYRLNDAVVISVAADIKNFYLGYSFDYSTSSIRSASAGSHEVVLGYSLKLDLGDKNRNSHRSIRYM